MGLMHRFIYKFSIFAGLAALVVALLNGVSIPTSVFRAVLVFLGVLLLFIILLNVLRWAIISTTIIEKHEEENEDDPLEDEARKELRKQLDQSKSSTTGTPVLEGDN